MRIILFSLIVIGSFTLLAQNSIQSSEYPSIDVNRYFNEERYEQVIRTLNTRGIRSDEEELFYQLSAQKTGKQKISQIARWVDQHPNHPLNSLANLQIAQYYLDNQLFDKANHHLSQVESMDLTGKHKSDFAYASGLLSLEDGSYENAIKHFATARTSQFEQINKLNYYQAYAYYQLADYDQALEGFERARFGDYQVSANYFKARILLDRGEWDQVINLAKGELSDESSSLNAGLYQIIGEAYAEKEDLAKADAYFERAIELHPSIPPASMYYQSGITKFKLGNESKAIDYLTQSGIQGGAYAQLSAFQLGRLYLQKEDYSEALSAFQEACSSQDSAILQESQTQAAKISAKLNDYTGAIQYAKDYLNDHPNGANREEMQNLIAQSYLLTANYGLAIDHLEEIGISNRIQQSVYQKVTYQKGVRLFNDASFSESSKWFLKSLEVPIDQSLMDDSNFHLGEIESQIGNPDKALTYYKSQSQWSPETYYGIGYILFNQQSYKEAIGYFQKAIQMDNLELQNDARVRLADCLYATKSYGEALELYTRINRNNASAYVHLQRGLALKATGNRTQAIDALKLAEGDQQYGRLSLFQLGLIYFESSQFETSIPVFAKVIELDKKDDTHARALLNRGLAYKNIGEFKMAKTDFIAVLDNHLSSDMALNAILGLQEIQSRVEVDQFDEYLTSFRAAHPEEQSLEDIDLETAKRFYFNENYESAISTLDRFMKAYPNSFHANEVRYYLAESYFKVDSLRQAAENYEVLKDPWNSYTSRALMRLGFIYQDLKQIQEAIDAYQTLKTLQATAKETFLASRALMLIYASNGECEKVISLADEILEMSNTATALSADREALMLKANCYLTLTKAEEAVEIYNVLIEDNDRYAAESVYKIGWVRFEAGEYENAQEILFDSIEKTVGYPEWSAKAYLLIARSYIELDQIFQAKATLRSIIQHADHQESIKEAEALLNQIEQATQISDTTKTNGQ